MKLIIRLMFTRWRKKDKKRCSHVTWDAPKNRLNAADEHINIHICTDILIYMYRYVCTYICIFICSSVYMYVHTYMYKYICKNSWGQWVWNVNRSLKYKYVRYKHSDCRRWRLHTRWPQRNVKHVAEACVFFCLHVSLPHCSFFFFSLQTAFALTQGRECAQTVWESSGWGAQWGSVWRQKRLHLHSSSTIFHLQQRILFSCRYRAQLWSEQVHDFGNRARSGQETVSGPVQEY